MTLCEKCIHGDICADRDCVCADDEIALKHCANFKNKADFVEVVRCKDCIHRNEDDFRSFYCRKDDVGCKDDDFCSYGERKI